LWTDLTTAEPNAPSAITMKMDFTQLIRDESAALRALHERVHATCGTRDSGRHARDAWSQPCHEFHTYVSRLDPFLQRAFQDSRYSDPELIEFVVCFLEVDPFFFRSGYLKQDLLTRIKRSELTESVKRRLRAVLIDAANRRGTREFKYYGRLAAAIADDTLRAQLDTIASGDPSARTSRARRMLARIRQRDLQQTAGAAERFSETP
jgi:hypothetical protein